MRDYLFLDNKTTVIADDRMNSETVKKLWNSFTLTTGEIRFKKGEGNTYSDCGWAKEQIEV